VSKKIRLSMEVSEDVAKLINELASDTDTTKTEVIRRALSVMKAYKEQKARGRGHIGFTEDPTQLDAEIIGIL